MIRIFILFLMVLGCFGLFTAPWPVAAQNKIFVSPETKNTEKPKRSFGSQLFLSKKKSAGNKRSFLSRIFGGQNSQTRQTVLKDLPRTPESLGFNFDKFHAHYKQGLALGADAVNGIGPEAKNVEELQALAAARKAPMMMAMLEKRERDQVYRAAYQKRQAQKALRFEQEQLAERERGTVNSNKSKRKIKYVYTAGQKKDKAKPKKVFSNYR